MYLCAFKIVHTILDKFIHSNCTLKKSSKKLLPPGLEPGWLGRANRTGSLATGHGHGRPRKASVHARVPERGA